MAGENLDLKIIIDTLLNAKGFTEAQAGLKSLANTTNTSAKGFDDFGSTTKKAGEKIGGARGPIGDLTRSILVSIGATRGAGEAARVAGLSMNVFEGATKGAALALAGISLGIVLLLPKLIEWLGASAKLAEKNAELAKSLSDEDEQLQKLVQNVPGVLKIFKEWAAAVHQVAMDQQAMKMDELVEQMNALVKEGEKGLGMWDRLVQWLKDDTVGVHEDTEATKKLREHKGHLIDTFLALSKQMSVLAEAQRRGITVQQLEDDEIKKGAQAKTGLKISQEAYTRAIKQWEFAERSAAIARDKQKKQETEEIERERRLIILYRQEAAAKREAARAASEAAADEILTENEKDDAIFQAKKQAAVSALGIMAQVFSKNKAVNIASAIADTYAAATVALKSAPPPFNYILMAAVIAQGMSNVANIRKTQPGFDDPMSDMIAVKLGRKSAEDFVRLFGQGFHGGLTGAIGQPTSVHNTTINRGVTANVSGVVGSQTEMKKWLVRMMTEAQRGEGRVNV